MHPVEKISYILKKNNAFSFDRIPIGMEIIKTPSGRFKVYDDNFSMYFDPEKTLKKMEKEKPKSYDEIWNCFVDDNKEEIGMKKKVK